MKQTLCFIEYPFKMSLAAKKQFKDITGLDLWNTLLKYLTAFRRSEGLQSFERLEVLTGVCDFLTASELLHALFIQENSCVSLEEIQDAMAMVEGRPLEDDSDKCLPWVMVMVLIALDVDSYQQKNLKEFCKKKADLSAQ